MSRLIKSGRASLADQEKKIISIQVLEPSLHGNETAASMQVDTQKNTIIDKARNEADALLRKAAARAEEMRKQLVEERRAWEHEKFELTEQARSQGYQQGLEEGRNSGYAEVKQSIEFARGIIDSAKQDYKLHVASAEKTVLELGLKVAGKILGAKVENDHEQFFPLVKRALKEAKDYREIQLHVNPVHYDLLMTRKGDLITLFPKETDLYIFPDDDLTETSCIIESANGRIDASIDTQLEEVKRKLFEMLETNENESS